MAFWNKIGRIFRSGARAVIEDFVAPVFRKGFSDELALVLPIAARVTAQLAAGGLDSKAKRAAALDAIGKELVAGQLSVAASAINIAIELAVQKLKAAR
jgi:hypothetical protein